MPFHFDQSEFPAAGTVDLLVNLGGPILARVEKLLRQFLAGADSREDDVNVVGVFEARKKDHVPGQIEDFDGLSHVENEDVSRIADCAGLQDQLDRLGDGHEKAFHLRMRDGDRPARLNLSPERRNHAAGRVQHVAESDGDEPRC